METKTQWYTDEAPPQPTWEFYCDNDQDEDRRLPARESLNVFGPGIVPHFFSMDEITDTRALLQLAAEMAEKGEPKMTPREISALIAVVCERKGWYLQDLLAT